MPELGSLERAVMEVLWAAKGPQPVRAVAAALDEADPSRPPRAYTTVQTVADRLVVKGLLERTSAGRAWNYEPTLTHAEHVAQLMVEALGDVKDRSGALRGFVGLLGKRDQRIVREALPPAPAPRKRA